MTPAGHAIKPLLGTAVIILLVLLAYVPAMKAGFVWDDDVFLTENPLIKASDGPYRFWFTTEPPDYFPLTSSMLWIEWRLWGRNATGYHVVNVLLHVISTLLVWRVLSKLRIPGAWLAALIFGIHPVNVESVAWITERKNTLPMVFYLATMLLYLNFEHRQRKLYYALALIAFLLALLSKTSVVMLPLVLLITAWWQRGKINRKDIYQVIPFFGLAIVFGLITCWFQHNRAIGGDIIRTDGMPARIAGAGWAVWFYLSKVLVPYKLTFVYPRWQIDPSSLVSYLPLVALAGFFFAFWQYRAGWGKPFLAGLGYYVITLLPVLGFIDIYFMRFSLVTDHWQYTAIIGAIALVVGLAARHTNRKPEKYRTPASILAVSVVAGLSILTWRQASIYTNIETLWQDTLAKNPSAWMAHHNLGGIYHDQKHDSERAIDHFSKCIQLNPDYAKAYFNLGVVLDHIGDCNRAIHNYTKAIEIEPDAAAVYYNRGNCYSQIDELEKALADYSKAIELKPDFAKAHYNRANVYYYLKDYDNAWAGIRKYQQLGGTPHPELIDGLIKASGRTE